MPAPTDDFLNDAEDALLAALEASPDFMKAGASGAPPAAHGPIAFIEADLPETENILKHRLPHAGVVYLGDDPLVEEGSASESRYNVQIGVRLYHRGANRKEVWRTLKKAAAIVAKVVAKQMSPSGGQFDGLANLAYYRGGTAIDTKEKTGFGAQQLVRVTLQITRPDYEEAP